MSVTKANEPPYSCPSNVGAENHGFALQYDLVEGYSEIAYGDQDSGGRCHYKTHEFYDTCASFCTHRDQVLFDLNYETQPRAKFCDWLEVFLRDRPTHAIDMNKGTQFSED